MECLRKGLRIAFGGALVALPLMAGCTDDQTNRADNNRAAVSGEAGNTSLTPSRAESNIPTASPTSPGPGSEATRRENNGLNTRPGGGTGATSGVGTGSGSSTVGGAGTATGTGTSGSTSDTGKSTSTSSSDSDKDRSSPKSDLDKHRSSHKSDSDKDRSSESSDKSNKPK